MRLRSKAGISKLYLFMAPGPGMLILRARIILGGEILRSDLFEHQCQRSQVVELALNF